MVVTLTGFMGCGKSSIGPRVAESLDWKFIDLDAYIVHKAGMSIPMIMEEGGEERFRAIEAEALRDVVTMSEITGEDVVLSLGGGTITISSIRHLILDHSESFYLRTQPSTIAERLKGEMDSRPLLKTGKFEDLLRKREPIYNLAANVVDTDGKSVDEIAAEIVGILKEK